MEDWMFSFGVLYFQDRQHDEAGFSGCVVQLCVNKYNLTLNGKNLI